MLWKQSDATSHMLQAAEVNKKNGFEHEQRQKFRKAGITTSNASKFINNEHMYFELSNRMHNTKRNKLHNIQ